MHSTNYLSAVDIKDYDITGLKINGIPIVTLLENYVKPV
jgi:hypothetical protein